MEGIIAESRVVRQAVEGHLLPQVLKALEENMPQVTWRGGDKPTNCPVELIKQAIEIEGLQIALVDEKYILLVQEDSPVLEEGYFVNCVNGADDLLKIIDVLMVKPFGHSKLDNALESLRKKVSSCIKDGVADNLVLNREEQAALKTIEMMGA